MDKLGALNMFVATAEHGSFSRAAEQLGKTPSALTKAVSHLEAELGARLFERSTRRTVLTEAGRVYLETARQVLQRLHEVGEEIGQRRAWRAGALSGELAQDTVRLVEQDQGHSRRDRRCDRNRPSGLRQPAMRRADLRRVRSCWRMKSSIGIGWPNR